MGGNEIKTTNVLMKPELNCIMSGDNIGQVEAPPIEELWGGIVDHVKNEYLSASQLFPWIIGFSGGKDSTVVAQAVFEAILNIPPSKRTRPIHIVSNDTMVESPLVINHLNSVTKKIEAAAINLGLPITTARTKPHPDKTFWVLLIGKGYPCPNKFMRWCTDRLKILPTSSYIKEQVSKSGAAIVVLGVRKDESQLRLRTIKKHRNLKGGFLSAHERLTGAFIFRPIENLTTFNVWEILLCFDAPWGGNHRDIIQLYKDAEGVECPVVLSQDEAPSCGTSGSRFGCWTCTVIEKDKSLQAVVDSGGYQYKPLIEFRNWLRDIRDDPTMRQAIRRNGKLTFGASGKQIPGPFTIKARKQILDRLLKVQEEFGQELITLQELDFIYQNWTAELQDEKRLIDG